MATLEKALNGKCMPATPPGPINPRELPSPGHLVTLSPSQLLPVAGLAPNLGETVVKVLAVAGGAALGGLLVPLVLRAAVKLAVRKTAPRSAVALSRLLGTVLCGLLVYLFVFGTGGGGLGGWGWGLGGGMGTGATAPAASSEPGAGTGRDRPDSAPTTQTQTGKFLAIEMLGGKRYKNDDRYYLIDSKPEPALLEEVRKTVEERLQARPPLQGIEIIIRADDSVSERDRAVEDLRTLARDRGLAVRLTVPGPS